MSDHRMPFRSSLLSVAAILALASMTAGCGKFQARMAFKEANEAYSSGDYRKAIKFYEEGLGKDPSVTRVWRSVGLANMALVQPDDTSAENVALADKAIKAFKEYLKAYPGDEEAEDFLLTTRIQVGKYDEALTQLNEAARKNPSDNKVNDAILRVLTKAGRLQEALQASEKPGYKPSASSLSTIAVEIWSKVYDNITLSTEQKASMIAMGLKAIDRAVKLDPNDLSANAYYGLLLREQAKIELDPDKVLQIMGEAEKWTQKAIAINKAQAAAQEEKSSEGK